MAPTTGCTTRTDQVERGREGRVRLLLVGEIDMEEMVDIFSLMYSVQVLSNPSHSQSSV